MAPREASTVRAEKATALPAVAMVSATEATTTTIDWRIALPFTLAAIAAVLVGKRVAERLDAQRSLRWFAVLLVAVALFTAIRATPGPAT
jgi:uncharacterized membrane protein YfcA